MNIHQKESAAEHIVVIGNGTAGVQLLDSLRSEGFEGTITIVGEEPTTPYQRPPLSKDYLLPGIEAAPLPLRPAGFFSQKGTSSLLGVQVTAIDRVAHAVTLSDGNTLGYDRLVLATGAANRELRVPGSDLNGIYGLRNLADAKALNAGLGTVRRAVVIGAGFIGLEFAAAARKRGIAVTVLEYANLPMARALTAASGGWFAEAHQDMGTDLRLGEGIAAFESDGKGNVAAAVSTTGAVYPADLVLTGIGVIPRTELAEAANLAVDNGITVDAKLRTSDPEIFALGDCANYPNVHTGSPTRLESVQNASDQARHLAKTLSNTQAHGEQDYAELPWFWSQQGPHKLQIAGLAPPGSETVVRGDPATGNFSIFCYLDGILAAVESINRPTDHMAARRLLATGRPLTQEQAADEDFDIKTYSKDSRPSAPITGKHLTPVG